MDFVRVATLDSNVHGQKLSQIILVLLSEIKNDDPSRGTVDTEGRYVPLFLLQLQ